MLWSYTLAGLGVISLYLTGKKLKSGWVVGIVNSGLWIAYGMTTEQYGFILSAIVFITVQAKNYRSWTAEERATHASL
jgi:nicotinamide riboside transporter PnuC